MHKQNQTEAVWHRVIAHEPALKYLRHLLPYMSVAQRKDLLTLCRVQCSPDTNSFLLGQLKTLNTHILLPLTTNSQKVLTMKGDIVPAVQQLIYSPMRLSLLSIMLRTEPYNDYSSIIEEINQGIEKELGSTILHGAHIQKLDYRPWLSEDIRDIHRPISRGFPINADLHKDIRARFRLWSIMTPCDSCCESDFLIRADALSMHSVSPICQTEDYGRNLVKKPEYRGSRTRVLR